MERVLGTPALFATAYGNVGSSIYYALGLTAVYALGLTPLVFVVAGRRLRRDGGDVRGRDGSLPRGGRLGELLAPRVRRARRASRRAGRRCSSTSSRSPCRRSSSRTTSRSSGSRCNTNPWDIVVGAIVIVVLVTLNVVGVQEAAKLSISLAVVDFATQVLLVIVGFALVFSPEVLVDNVHWGVAPTWSNLAIAIPVAMLAYTGVETVSNLAEEARDPVRTVPNSYKLVAGAVFAIYFTLPLVALSALPVERDRRRADDAARASARGGRLRERPDPRRRREHRARGAAPRRGARSTSASSRRRSSSSRRTRASSAPRASRTRWRPTGSCPRCFGGCTRGSRRRGSRSSSSRGSRRSS